MRYIGTIIDWNDEKGFGFVLYDNKQKRAFVHIKSFNSSQIRPVNGDVISYEISKDSNGKERAVNIALKRSESNTIKKQKANQSRDVGDSGHSFLGQIVIIAFVLLVISLASPQEMYVVIPVYFILGLITYYLYNSDKDAAERMDWRIPESKLLFWGLIGGWIGAIVAQRRLRHKNRKMDYQSKFWTTVAVNCIGLAFILTKI